MGKQNQCLMCFAFLIDLCWFLFSPFATFFAHSLYHKSPCSNIKVWVVFKTHVAKGKIFMLMFCKELRIFVNLLASDADFSCTASWLR